MHRVVGDGFKSSGKLVEETVRVHAWPPIGIKMLTQAYLLSGSEQKPQITGIVTVKAPYFSKFYLKAHRVVPIKSGSRV